MTLDQVRNLLLRKAAKHTTGRKGAGIYGWCKAHGVSRSHATEFVNGERLPTTDLLEALGLEWRVMRKTNNQKKEHAS